MKLLLLMLVLVFGCKTMNDIRNVSKVKAVNELISYTPIDYVHADSDFCKSKAANVPNVTLENCVDRFCNRQQMERGEVACLSFELQRFSSISNKNEIFRNNVSFKPLMFRDFIRQNSSNSGLIELNNIFFGSSSDFENIMMQLADKDRNVQFTLKTQEDRNWAEKVAPLWNEFIKNYPVNPAYIQDAPSQLMMNTIYIVGKSSWIPSVQKAHIDAHFAEFDGTTLRAGVSREILNQFKATPAANDFNKELAFEQFNNNQSPNLDRVDISMMGYDMAEFQRYVDLAKELTAMIRRPSVSSSSINDSDVTIIKIASTPPSPPIAEIDLNEQDSSSID